MPLSEKALRKRDAKRDIGAELLKSVRDVKAGRVGAVWKADASGRVAVVSAARARQASKLSQSQFAELLGVSVRTLQRLFARYVGASPLWVLRRQRLQDAVAALDAGEGQDLAALAAELGFADHAHLTRAFTAVVGVPPSRYRSGG